MRMEKTDVVKQTKLAFDFIQKLYLETSYLIKEMQGILEQEEEEFQILRPSGYGITTFRSIGLDAGVIDWCIRKGAVFFVAKANTELSRGQTITKFKPDLQVIVLEFLLHDKDLDKPEIWVGIVNNIVSKADNRKFESLTWKFAYYAKRILHNIGQSKYEDGEVSFDINMMKKYLYDIGSAEDIQQGLITPVLNLYRKKRTYCLPAKFYI